MLGSILHNGTYGKCGRGGQRPLILREHSDVPPWSLSFGLLRCLEFNCDLMQVDLCRQIPLHGSGLPPIVVASDGRLDELAPASVAAVCMDGVTGERMCLVAEIPVELRNRCAAYKYIGLVEQAAIVSQELVRVV